MPHPHYTSTAREAAIEGRVRVEITVGSSGEVRKARVITSLGYGLDEAALEAARAARFEPALECGRAVSATFVVSIRFSQ
jgi:protein TonB